MQITVQEPKRILLVGPDSPRCREVEGFLRGDGATVVRASTISEAREMLEEAASVEAAILDLDVPDVSAIEGVAQLRSADPAIPVLVLASDEQRALAVEASSAGAHGYLLEGQLQPELLHRTLTYAATQIHARMELDLAESTLLEFEQRCRALFDLSRDAICFVDADGVVVEANDPTAILFMRPLDRLVGMNLQELLVRDADRDRISMAIREKRAPESFDAPARRGDGRTILISVETVAWRDPLEAFLGFFCSIQAADEAATAEGRVASKMLHDPLTGLPTRSILMDRLEQARARRRRDEETIFAVLFVDLDQFKAVNDSFGHLVGDELLRRVGERLRDSVREPDTVARMGGDEFVVLLSEIEALEDATFIANRIVEELGRPFRLGDREVGIGCSIGITLPSSQEVSAEDLLHQADQAMYQAKAAGKGTFEVYDHQLQARIMRTLEMDAEIRRALDRGELTLFYQPVVDAGSGRVVSFEALLRWKHPERGLISPGQFIGTAEERGLISEIGQWVVDEVCEQLSEWRRRFPSSAAVGVSINLSPTEFHRPGFVDHLESALQRHDIPSNLLSVELTEAALVTDPTAALGTLDRLRKLGIRVSIDNFGVGVGAWSYLRPTAVDSLKVQSSRVLREEAEADEEGEAPDVEGEVAEIARLARCLGVDTVVERVETEAQLEQSREAGTTLAQGFLFWEPMAADEASALLDRQGSNGGRDGAPAGG